MTTPHREQSIRKLADLIQDIEVAMVTTEDEQGELRSRPMATQKSEFDGTLWFFTLNSSPKVTELKSHRRVNISYSNPRDPKDQHYISVSGVAEIVQDPQLIQKMWNPALKSWFPQGSSDPELSLIKVDVRKAEYWEATSGKMVQLPAKNEKFDLTG